jgi:putative membrane protein insertion efficiency factor
MPRRLLLAVLACCLVAFGFDLSRPPDRQISARVALAGVSIYQATLSPLYARLGVVCRFQPTCSHYARECLRSHGLLQGSWLAVRRVLRCGPWTPAGSIDPPPVPVG